LLVVADGRRSEVRGVEPPRRQVAWFGWNVTLATEAAAPGALAMYFCRDGYVGTMTFADGRTNVCGLTRCSRRTRTPWPESLARAAAQHPSLGRLVDSGHLVTPFRGVGPLLFSPRMRLAPGALLGGDAAAVGDPYFGEGISRALGTGAVLRETLTALGTSASIAAITEAYRNRWRQRYRVRLAFGTVARSVVARPGLLGGAVGLFPSALPAVLAIAHGGSRRIQ
jgi:2-polyprenyl-6-methoxyphenol hydroxylase-like FAD-dependent oxidoreductase